MRSVRTQHVTLATERQPRLDRGHGLRAVQVREARRLGVVDVLDLQRLDHGRIVVKAVARLEAPG